uniref:Uncharacterized protein n=1 Tax=Oryza rufipogon TaxID=4529 RepID=A0A0E0R9R3_ORYRU
MWFGYSPQLVFLLICIRNSWLYRKVLSPDLWFTQNELAIRTFIIDIEHVGDRTYHTLMRSIHEYNLQNSPFTCLNAAVTPAGGYHMILLYKGQKSVRLLFRDSDGYLVAVEDDLAEMKMESGYGDMETSEKFVSKRFKVFMDLEFPSDLWKLVHNWGHVSKYIIFCYDNNMLEAPQVDNAEYMSHMRIMSFIEIQGQRTIYTPTDAAGPGGALLLVKAN